MTQQSDYNFGGRLRPKFVPITSTSDNGGDLTKTITTSTTTYTYTLANFSGTGYVAANVTSIEILANATLRWDAPAGVNSVEYYYPDGTWRIILSETSHGNGDDHTPNTKVNFSLPVNSGQTTIQLRLTMGSTGSLVITASATFTIFGAVQLS